MLPAMHWSLALKVGSAAKNGTVIQSRTCIQRTLLLVCARAQPEPGRTLLRRSIVGFSWTLVLHAVTTLLHLLPIRTSLARRATSGNWRRSTEDLVLLGSSHVTSLPSDNTQYAAVQHAPACGSGHVLAHCGARGAALRGCANAARARCRGHGKRRAPG